jgi:dihydrofolate reductase
MRKLIVSEWMTLDGVVQAPISPDEDTDGGFKHGGWHARHTADPVFQQRMIDVITSASAFLYGRRTYQIFAAFWPNAPKEQAALADPINQRPKYVVSKTLAAPLPWQGSTILNGDTAEAVSSLKRDGEGNLLVFGSTQLVATLIEHDLVDELRLVIDPVIVGGGKSIFPRDGSLRSLRLVDSLATATGALITTYTR